MCPTISDYARLRRPQRGPRGAQPQPSAAGLLRKPESLGTCGSARARPAVTCRMPQGPETLNDAPVGKQEFPTSKATGTTAQAPRCTETLTGHAGVDRGPPALRLPGCPPSRGAGRSEAPTRVTCMLRLTRVARVTTPT